MPYRMYGVCKKEKRLVGAGVVEKDFTDITITLTEKQRAQAIAMSGTPGGDYGGMFLDVKNASMRDRSGNLVQEP